MEKYEDAFQDLNDITGHINAAVFVLKKGGYAVKQAQEAYDSTFIPLSVILRWPHLTMTDFLDQQAPQ